MNALASAIFNKLNVSTLTDLLADTVNSSIYQSQAPDNSLYPFVIFNKMSDTEDNDTAHRIVNSIYQVRGFTKVDMKSAQAIAEAADGLLHNKTLTITGFAQLRLIRIGGVEFVENQQSTDKVYSAGSLFRLLVEKTS
jgi:hypothetical protein